MAKGYPDYYGQMSFPREGFRRYAYGSHGLEGVGTYDIVTISSKGIILDGMFAFTDMTGPNSFGIHLYVDGNFISSLGPIDALMYSGVNRKTRGWECIYYSNQMNDCIFELRHHIYFERTFNIQLSIGAGSQCSSSYLLYYTELTD